MLSAIRLGAAALLLALAGSLPALAQDWSRYSAPDGSFSAEFPIQPTITNKSDEIEMEASPTEHESFFARFAVMQVSMESDPEKYFSAAIKALDSDGNKLTIHPTDKVQGHPSKDIKVVLPNGVIVWDRVIIVDDRLYQLIYATDSAESEPWDFWSTFELAQGYGG